MAGIGIIANPHSKLNKRHPGREEILGYIAGEQGTLQVTKSLEELTAVARQFMQQKIEILAINGGDGTIMQTLTTFIKVYGNTPLPKIALLRGGTINVLATNLYIQGTPETILYRLIENYSLGYPMKSTKLATIAVEGRYGFLFANGASSRFLSLFYKNKTGPLGAVALVLKIALSGIANSINNRLFGKLYRSIVKDDPTVLHIGDGEQVIDHSTTGVFCSTVEKMPLGVKLFPNARERLSMFSCVSFAMRAKDLVFKLPEAVLVRPESPVAGKLSFQTNQLRIASPVIEPYTLDGDLFEPKSNILTLGMGPIIEFIVA